MEKQELEKMLNQGMSLNDISKETKKSLTTVRYWCKKHSLKSNYSKFKNESKNHKCSICGETNPKNFYGHKKSICGSCHNSYTLDKGKQNRNFIIENMGGRCINCGFDKYQSALQVHHLDPSKKDKNFSSIRGWSKQRIIDEIKECVLLCANCHSAVHSNELIL